MHFKIVLHVYTNSVIDDYQKVSEYDKGIPQSHTASMRKSHKTLTVTRYQQDIKAKQQGFSHPRQDDCKTRKDTK